MTEEPELEVADLEMLEAAASQILEYFRSELDVESIPIENYFYWDFPGRVRYDVHHPPTEDDIVLGDLNFDLEKLNKILDRKRVPVGHDLVCLGELLRYVGENIIDHT